MIMIGMPSRPPHGRAAEQPVGNGITFTAGHHFNLTGDTDIGKLVEDSTAPLSVILQVTKRCDFDCVFCSETLQMRDPTLQQLATMRDNLEGVSRVFLSGGEPLLRRDFTDVVEIFNGFIIGVPTNATRGVGMAQHLAGKVAFVNIGFDGPRGIFSRVRGDYDKALAGVKAMISCGLPISLSAVVLRSTLHGLPYLHQIADVFDAGKLKLILPLRKGNALGLDEREFITEDEARDAFDRLNELRVTHDWRPAVRLTPWNDRTEGHMIVIEPNGNAQAWPVYAEPDLFLPLGNVLEEPISTMWARYPYKANHFAKYLGHSIHITGRASVL
jgi:MoaA/NifB/PqqE/SkfB family radical SAM enzyme